MNHGSDIILRYARHACQAGVLLPMLACGGGSNNVINSTKDTGYVDADMDGYPDTVDCDDSDPSVHPEAEEICNDGIDNDCSGDSAGCELRGEFSLDDLQTAVLTGEASDQAGFAVALPGDASGDGLPDILIGAPNASVGAAERGGYVYLVNGPITADETLSASSGARMGASVSGGAAGYSVSGAGDLNADGVADIVIGAPGIESDTCNKELTGTAYALLGPVSGDVDLDDADLIMHGDTLCDAMGTRVVATADLNGNGTDDLAVSAFNYTPDGGGTHHGAVFLFDGETRGEYNAVNATLSLLLDAPQSAWGGWSLASGQDVNGDGYADMLIGIPYLYNDDIRDAGGAYLVYGSVHEGVLWLLNHSDSQWFGEEEDGLVGTQVAMLPDMDSDGNAEMIISSVYESSIQDEAGAVYFLDGSLEGSHVLSEADGAILGDSEYNWVGAAVDSAGDFDQDGHPDLLLGIPGFSPGYSGAGLYAEGGAYVVYEPDLDAVQQLETFSERGDVLFQGVVYSAQVGSSVAGGADLDGDGLDDLVLGAPGTYRSDAGAGMAYVVFGQGG